MAVWVHCNKCGKDASGQICFHLTSCFHVFCSVCIQDFCQDSTCAICSERMRSMEINGDTPREVLSLFEGGNEVIRRVHVVFKFQLDQYSSRVTMQDQLIKQLQEAVQSEKDKRRQERNQWKDVTTEMQAQIDGLRSAHQDLLIQYQQLRQQQRRDPGPGPGSFRCSTSRSIFNSSIWGGIFHEQQQEDMHFEAVTPMSHYDHGDNFDEDEIRRNVRERIATLFEMRDF